MTRIMRNRKVERIIEDTIRIERENDQMNRF